jgi:hypothetical protein
MNAADDSKQLVERLRARDLVEAFRRHSCRGPARPRVWAIATLAASLALFATFFTPREAQPPGDEAAAALVPLRYGDPLGDVAAVHIVGVAVDRSALASYGWPAAAGDAPTVNAEVLVGQDGLPRAIRFEN